jgi:hypothetical protein
MKLELSHLTPRTDVEDHVHASVTPTHTEKGRTTTGSPEDVNLTSPRVLAARAELIAAAEEELAARESQKDEPLEVVRRPAPEAAVEAAAVES